ncbi:RsfA family transcriptional regulator [Falsibacillus pallidus]|uniref:RsfA family transcription factor n=1 Tax=Falsibacillus pallidus TaxID=493781 RepID=A0A370GWC7_9BACI|nr:RsfA family transcriptional regulator [Falsibacillus pallidus]RDI47566.1 RsfA family transcription factor [Falsibacillus pallidus]
MTSTRQDAWSQDEDLLLAEVVLKHIREGGTQLHAFEEVGKRLSRTAAACGFRWNSFVRKQYRSGIELAKKHRKEAKKKKNPASSQPAVLDTESTKDTPNKELSVKDFIAYVEKLESEGGSVQKLKNEIEELKKDQKQLRARLAEAEQNYLQTRDKYHALEEDYRSLLGILDRARKMAVMEEHEKEQKVKFTMDKNGNLQRLNK